MNQSILVKDIKKKNRVSNVLIAVGALFDLIPRFLTIHMAASFIAGRLTVGIVITDSCFMLSSFLIKAICSYYATWEAHKAAYGTLTDLRLRLIRHLKKLPLGFFQERKTGDLTNIVEHDVEQVEFYLAHGLPEIMSATLFPAIIFAAMLFLDWRLALLMVSSLPLMLLIKKGSAAVWDKNQRMFVDSTKAMQENMMEYIQNIAVIKAFGKEETKTQNTIQLAKDYVRAARKAAAGVSLSMGFIDIFMEGGVVLVMILGSGFLLKGQISVPVFVLSMILGGAFTASIAKTATLQHYNIVFHQAMREVGSVLDVSASEKKEAAVPVRNGDIRIQGVDFSYPGKGRSLENINLTFKKGSRNAIVGASGCGKSTLVSLIMGFWIPQTGRIQINGVDIKSMSEKQWNAFIAIVQQDTFLFNMSVEENIRLGKPDATRGEIVAASKKANIHSFISSLPQGYDTKAGESGVKFSGGEKQRIAIARMILKDAPILILDEATAAVDAENEASIQAALENFSKGKTVISITHHLNTIRNADQIIVMDSGHVVDRGTHQELTERCKLYQKAVQDQNQTELWSIKEG
ncbi:putative multidrug export ATP-binding/permease protein [Caprobacter fermentans]|uniref:Putative multidrug export ATP-binding/permease protein n=1 Tax=Caproicibacter fermentans TaxID=2576756 RepID=A0A6N8I2C0_9FIRM|nr:ABC transporter ATP-binding protein [Caproicibacter fermentans]MVB12271.1 putative multidrug export ATP-binding/permease protein [Caproicibacter fermentans]